MALMDYVLGYQHVGIPTKDIEESTAFYKALGFEMIYETKNNGNKVRFFSAKSILIEVYEKEDIAEKRGAIDHVALLVNNIVTVSELAEKENFKIVEGPHFLPFWENGVKYICIEGPNSEIIEFIQKY